MLALVHISFIVETCGIFSCGVSNYRNILRCYEKRLFFALYTGTL
jgi:hypothetical protein